MTRTTKRKTLLTSILLFFVFVFSLLFIGFSDKVKVKAEDIPNGKYITVDNVTDTATDKGATLSYTEGSGLLVDSIADSASSVDKSYDMFGEYSGRINGVFKTSDTNVIGLAFPNVSKVSTEFEFTFKVESVDGVGDYFLVKYYAQHASLTSTNRFVGKLAVIYVDAETRAETFRSVDFNETVLHSREEADAVAMYSVANTTDYVEYVSLPTIGDLNETPGTFTLDWDDDGVLTVKAPLLKQGNVTTERKSGKYKENATIATFNGDETDGLPKIAFEKGYKISFTSNSCQDVLFTQIGGTDLTAEVTTPAWYQSDAANPSTVYSTATVMLDGKVQGAYPVDKAISLPSARWLTNTDQGDATLTVKDSQGGTVDPANGLSAGTYTAIYTGGATGVEGNVVEIPFTVKSNLFTAVNDAVASTTGTVQTMATVGRHTGTLVSADGAYDGQINGVFTDAAKVEFLLPVSNATLKDFNLTFKVEDATDASNYFEIVYYYTAVSHTVASMSVKYVQDNEAKYVAYYYNRKHSSSAPSGMIEGLDTTKNNTNLHSVVQPNHDTRTSYFKLGWEGDVFCVYTPQILSSETCMAYNGYSYDVALAKFDGNTDTVAVAETPDRVGTGNSYGLPKIAFENGYKISFTSATKQSILFTEIAGDDAPVDLALDFADGGYSNNMPTWYSNYKAMTAKAEINGATLSLSTDIAVRFLVEKAKLDLYEESKLEATFNGATKELIAADETMTVEGVDYKVFTLYGIRPDQMGETITATLSGKKAGEAELSELDTLDYSVKTYCDNKLADENASAELKAVCTALLNYGSSAQQYTRVNSSTLVNPNYNATPTAPTYEKEVSQTNEVEEVLSWAGANLSLSEKVAVTFYVSAVGTTNTFHVNAHITYGNGKTHEIDLTYYEKQEIEGNSYYVITFDQMTAEDLSGDITIQLIDYQSIAKSEKLTYSLEAYANSVVNDSNSSQTMKNLSIYLMEYVNAVKAYVASLA